MEFQFDNFKILTAEQQKRTKEIVETESKKLEREMGKIQKLVLTFKEYETDGTQHKHMVNMRVEGTGKPITVEHNVASWNELTCIHKLFQKVANQVRKRYHTD